MTVKIKEFKSNFVLLTLWKGQEGKADYFTISQISKTPEGKWEYIRFLRAKDIPDLIEVANQYKEWEEGQKK